MRLFDPAHPFFRPAWRRYLTVAFPFLWASFEYSAGNTVWAYLFAALGGYCAWYLILTWRAPDDDD